MSIITLRGLNSEAEQKIRRRAAHKGISMNRFLLDLIEDNVLGSKEGKPHEYDDLDELIGSMNKADVKKLDKSVSEQRKIDPELWQ